MAIGPNKPSPRVILATRRRRAVQAPPASRLLSGVSVKLIFQDAATNLWAEPGRQRALNQDDVLFVECFNSMLGINLMVDEDQNGSAPGDARLRKYGFLMLSVDDESRDYFIDHIVLNYETRRAIATVGDSTGEFGETLTWLRTRTRELVSDLADAMDADGRERIIS